MKTTLMLVIITFFSISAFAEDFDYPFLDKETMKATQFIKTDSDYDGRGALVFILDCGVDPLINGLDKTSQGDVKVIDMQDFTGQLVVPLTKAEIDTSDRNLLVNEILSLEGLRNLSYKSSNGKYFMGQIDEASAFKNSGVHDINSNGKTNDIFIVLAFKVEKGTEVLKNASGLVKPDPEEDLWIYYIDEDSDGSIDDETGRFDYKYRYDTFNFHKGDKKVLPLLTFAANINNDVPSLTIVTCEGSHGSHCAGIACGNSINGAIGNNGIAPGAYVANLKIGSNILSGGATTTSSMKRAYEYGVEFMKKAGFKTAVFSMSYGIGSEQPGRSDVDKFLNDFAFAHPEAVIVKSMGNSGPGINSTGNPSGALGVISVGAMCSPSTLRDLYGSSRKINWVTHFSSRGGETSKPDVIAPGAAASTVPAYTNWDAFWGTSMSTPQVAGACALLISAAQKNNLDINSFMIKKAIKFTARPMPGYNYLDYGNGMVDIPRAFEYLEVLSKRNESSKVHDYEITTANTFYSDKSGPTAFWRSNGYFPGDGEKQAVTVKAIYPENVPEKDKNNFYRAFSLKSSANWLETDKSKIYIRGAQPARFNLMYDRSKMKKSGVYVARVFAYAENEEDGGFADFDVQATVVVPYTFNQDNDYTRTFSNQSLNTGDIERIFVEVPAGASSMNVKLGPVGSKWFNMGLYLFSPDGNRSYVSYSTDTKMKKEINVKVEGDKLQKGIWEILPYCYYLSKNTSYFDLNVQFYGVHSNPDTIRSLSLVPGDFATGSTKIINQYNGLMKANISGSILGYSYKENYSQTGQATFSKKIKIGKDVRSVLLNFDMPVSEYNKVTDLAINIYDAGGKSIKSSGMSRKYHSVNFTPASSGEYTLDMVPGFVSDEIMAQTWTFSIEEKYYYKNEIAIVPYVSNQDIIPGIWNDMSFQLGGQLPAAPTGCHSFGEINIIDNANKNLIRKQVLYLE